MIKNKHNVVSNAMTWEFPTKLAISFSLGSFFKFLNIKVKEKKSGQKH